MAVKRQARHGPTTILAAIRCGLALALVFGSFASFSALAENIPLPTPAPLPKTGIAPLPPASDSPAADAQKPGGLFPFTLPLGKNSSGQATAFDDKQRALLGQHQHVSVQRADHGGKFRSDRTRWWADRGDFLYSKARPRAI